MKVRTGFVSNSSSSSYIVAADRDNTTFTIKIDLAHLSDGIISTFGDLDAYMLDRHGYYDGCDTIEDLLKNEPYLRETYNKCKAQLVLGKKVYFGSLTNEGYGEGIEEYLYNNGFYSHRKDNDNIEIIEEG